MQATLVNNVAIAAAAVLAADPNSTLKLVDAPTSLCIQAAFTYGAGGTAVDAWVQTSIDGGASWIDIAQFHFTTASLTQVVNLNSQTVITTPYTPTDGTLTASTCKDGILGPQYRIKRQSTGTYTGATSLRIDVSAQEP